MAPHLAKPHPEYNQSTCRGYFLLNPFQVRQADTSQTPHPNERLIYKQFLKIEHKLKNAAKKYKGKAKSANQRTRHKFLR